MENESLSLIWTIVTGGLIMPLVQYIKKRLPGDFPVQPIIYSLGLALLTLWLLSRWLAPEMSLAGCLAYAMASNLVSQYAHAIKNSYKKVML